MSPAGYPTLARAPNIVPALAQAGADLIEIGIPFSDPLADGATIQRASQVALAGRHHFRRLPGTGAHGATARWTCRCSSWATTTRSTTGAWLARAGRVRRSGSRRPDRARPAARRSRRTLAAARAHDLALIFLVSPVSSDARLAAGGGAGSGFLYCVSLTGVTGARASCRSTLPDFLARVRRAY